MDNFILFCGLENACDVLGLVLPKRPLMSMFSTGVKVVELLMLILNNSVKSLFSCLVLLVSAKCYLSHREVWPLAGWRKVANNPNNNSILPFCLYRWLLVFFSLPKEAYNSKEKWQARKKFCIQHGFVFYIQIGKRMINGRRRDVDRETKWCGNCEPSNHITNAHEASYSYHTFCSYYTKREYLL